MNLILILEQLGAGFAFLGVLVLLSWVLTVVWNSDNIIMTCVRVHAPLVGVLVLLALTVSLLAWAIGSSFVHG